jgi:serine/threonine-protein kinase
MPAASQKAKRYIIRDVLGKGGMGIVYRAYDNETRREVTLKSLIDLEDSNLLELFRRETQVLASINHPNIVDIYDVGELVDEDRVRRPYFVMPLLPGVTLDQLIAHASHRLTPDRVVDIVAQTCRGLHAAHERGLVHRDIKPSNIFVLDDDSVKIIDFGVAHLAGSRTATSLKGTLHYMAPEQVQLQKPTPLSDLFSLAVVAYEALTRRRPFDGASLEDTVQAILHRNPPPVCDLNPTVSRLVSQVVHKGMAKQPWNRFANVREFADHLQRAFRGEQLPLFDESKIITRVQKAQRAVENGEYEFADEVLSGLEAESWIHPRMPTLRKQLDEAMRARTIRLLLESARRYFQEEEFQLALQKVQEVTQIDSDNSEALALRAEIESTRAGQQVNQWLGLAQQHIQNHSYHPARQAVQNVLQLKPGDTGARRLLTEIDAREQEYQRLRRQKEELYAAAMEAFEKGELSTALAEMERVLELDRRAPETSSDRASTFQKSYQDVISKRDTFNAAYGKARQCLTEKNFKGALAVCDEYLAAYPGNALFQALRVDVEDKERQELSAAIARVDREVDAEPDLDRRISILNHALEEYPGEAHFERALQLVTARRELVESIVARARLYEERGQYAEAVGQWETLRNIHPAYPGLEFEIQRMAWRRDQQVRDEARRNWLAQIDAAMADGGWQRALDLVQHARDEFPGDAELEAREKLAAEARERSRQAEPLLEAARATENRDEAVELLNRAIELEPRNGAARALLLDALVGQARPLLDSEPEKAASLLNESLRIDPGNTLARSLLKLLEARRLREEEARNQDLNQAKEMEKNAAAISDPSQLQTILEQTVSLASRYAGDRDFESIVAFLRKRLDSAGTDAAEAPVPVETEKPAERPRLPFRWRRPPAKVLYASAGVLALLVTAATVAMLVAVFRDSKPPVVVEAREPEPATIPAPPPAVVEPEVEPEPAVPAVPTGALIIRANEADVTVLIDGRRRRYARRGSGMILGGIPAGVHDVEIRKPGYDAEPAVHPVEIRAGANAEIEFTLTAKPSGLVLRSAMPGTQVYIGGRLAGTVDPAGNLTLNNVPPGERTVELRRRGYRTRQLALKLNPGEPRDLFPAELELERMVGILQLQVTEPKKDVSLAIAPAQGVVDYDGPKELTAIPAALELPAGTYNFTISARGYQSVIINVQLLDGEVKPTIKIGLRKR